MLNVISFSLIMGYGHIGLPYSELRKVQAMILGDADFLILYLIRDRIKCTEQYNLEFYLRLFGLRQGIIICTEVTVASVRKLYKISRVFCVLFCYIMSLHHLAKLVPLT